MAPLLENKTFTLKVIHFLQKHILIIFLICVGILSRIFYIHDTVFPFSFDHGKDSIAVMDLILNRNLKFVGPWTSIPGLHFGPGWYYLITPGFLLTNFHPLGSVLVMLMLVLLQIYLAYRYFGLIPAVIVATGSFWLTLAKSAWNPFPMTLISWVILILLNEYKRNGSLTSSQFLLLGLTASLGFHFSAAFAIFYPLIIGLLIIKNKLDISFKSFTIVVIGFLVAFVPQFLFEIKNNFIQSKAVLSYFASDTNDTITYEKISYVTNSYFNALPYFVLPETVNIIHKRVIIIIFIFLILLYFIHNKGLKSEDEFDLFDGTLFIIIPYLGFLFLHYQVWYYYAIAPVVVVMFSKLLKNLNKKTTFVVVVIYLLSPIAAYNFYYSYDKPLHTNSRNFLPKKLEAIEYIYAQSNGEPFSSYHYVPDIYDYSYQYLYFWKARNGYSLPVEFSYQPNETAYIPEKQMLLTHFNQSNEKPIKVFYIVESAEESEFLDSWWNAQQFSKIVSTKEISPDITVYEASP